jgi:hypothetical protein
MVFRLLPQEIAGSVRKPKAIKFIAPMAPMGLIQEYLVVEHKSVPGGTIWGPDFHEGIVLAAAYELPQYQTIVLEVFERMAAKNILKAIVGKRERSAVQIHNTIDRRPRHFIDAETAFFLDAATPEIHASHSLYSRQGGGRAIWRSGSAAEYLAQ